jgi:sulfur carrier protein ThiS
MRFSPRCPLYCALVLWLALLCGAAQAQFTGFPGTTVRFASVAQGRAVLGTVDEWMPLTSELQRASTLGRTPPVSVEEFRAFSAEAVLPWTEPQQLRWRKALERLAPKFAALQVPLPPELLLISTNGRDAFGNPYTRGRAVVLPLASLPDRADADVYILAHELFHVVSRHAPALATRLYTTIGFESTAPLQWPAAWLPQRIANPDAPFDRHLMRTSFEGRAVALMPLLMAGRADLKAGESFFSVMQVRLLEVTPGDATRPTLPVLSDGQPVWHEPRQVPDYLARLGGNTNYILHPEETMADNFAFAVNGSPVPNQALLTRIEEVLRAEPR